MQTLETIGGSRPAIEISHFTCIYSLFQALGQWGRAKNVVERAKEKRVKLWDGGAGDWEEGGSLQHFLLAPAAN